MLIQYGEENLTHFTVHRHLITARQCYIHISVLLQINLLQYLVDPTYFYIIDKNPTLPAEENIEINNT
jgi:hypothetical protein